MNKKENKASQLSSLSELFLISPRYFIVVSKTTSYFWPTVHEVERMPICVYSFTHIFIEQMFGDQRLQSSKLHNT